jgi:hypothetical protein
MCETDCKLKKSHSMTLLRLHDCTSYSLSSRIRSVLSLIHSGYSLTSTANELRIATVFSFIPCKDPRRLRNPMRRFSIVALFRCEYDVGHEQQQYVYATSPY